MLMSSKDFESHLASGTFAPCGEGLVSFEIVCEHFGLEQHASLMTYLREIIRNMTRTGISDLAVVELDRSEGGIQFLDCSICPEEPAWWKLNHALALHGLAQSYPRSKQVFEDGCQIRYNLQPFGSSSAPPVRVTMNASGTCPAILMRLAWKFFQDQQAGCGSVLPVSNQGFPHWEDVIWRFGEAFATNESFNSPGTFGYSLRSLREDKEEENVVEKQHRIADYDAKGWRDIKGRRPCWTKPKIMPWDGISLPHKKLTCAAKEKLKKEHREQTGGSKKKSVSTEDAVL